MYDVICFGSATVDIFVNTGDKLFRRPPPHKKGCITVPFGDKIVVSDVRFDVGGGGTNTAVAFSRMGFRTAWMGKLGQGESTQKIVNCLRKEKVKVLVDKRSQEEPGVSIILDAKGHDRTVLTHKGCNNDISWSDVPVRKLKTRWIYCSSMMDHAFRTQENVCLYAKRHKINVMYNPSLYTTKKGRAYLARMLKCTTILSLNKEEAEQLVSGSIEQMAEKLSLLGPQIVIITNGAEGAYAYDRKHFYFVKGQPVKVVESTGAGDAFSSGFLSGFIKTGSMELALRFGVVNAQSVIQHFGAKNVLLTEKQAYAIMHKKNVRIVKKKC